MSLRYGTVAGGQTSTHECGGALRTCSSRGACSPSPPPAAPLPSGCCSWTPAPAPPLPLSPSPSPSPRPVRKPAVCCAHPPATVTGGRAASLCRGWNTGAGATRARAAKPLHSPATSRAGGLLGCGRASTSPAHARDTHAACSATPPRSSRLACRNIELRHKSQVQRWLQRRTGRDTELPRLTLLTSLMTSTQRPPLVRPCACAHCLGRGLSNAQLTVGRLCADLRHHAHHHLPPCIPRHPVPARLSTRFRRVVSRHRSSWRVSDRCAEWAPGGVGTRAGTRASGRRRTLTSNWW
jgi:hypothetical protein